MLIIIEKTSVDICCKGNDSHKSQTVG